MARKRSPAKKPGPPEKIEANPLPGAGAELSDPVVEQQPSSVKTLSTENHQPSAVPMEVHHHPEVEKKALKNICWKAWWYFLPFLWALLPKT